MLSNDSRFTLAGVLVVLGLMASDVNGAERRTKDLPKGIAAVQKISLEYDRPGKPRLKVQMDEPVVAAVAQKPEKWGYYQFPSLARGKTEGQIRVGWSMHIDSILSYGKGGGASVVSNDGGKTWGPAEGFKAASSGLLLPNGDRITVVTPKPIPCDQLKLPEPVGYGDDTYAKKQLPLYRHDELPAEVRDIRIRRLTKGDAKWKLETAKIIDPKALRYSQRNLFPIVWWGNLQVAPDGSV